MSETTSRAFLPAVDSLRSVHFGVTEFDKTLEFFLRDWGLSAVLVDDNTAYLRAAGTPAYVVALHRSAQTEVLRVDLTAKDKPTVDAIHQRLATQGAAGLSEPALLAEHGGGYGFRVRDFEGRPYLIVAEDQSCEAAPGISLPRKLSHVVLNSTDADALGDFFTTGLGFRLVDRTRRIHFLNCNADHHSIAVLPSSQSTLNHVAFEMDSFDSLMRGIGRLRDNGLEVGWGVGRHGPGNNIFVYFVGPEVLPLEYTAEVQQIDHTYRVGSPEDWAPIPGRMDQWGVTRPPTTAMKQAEQTIGFSQSTL